MKRIQQEVLCLSWQEAAKMIMGWRGLDTNHGWELTHWETVGSGEEEQLVFQFERVADD